MFKIVNNYQNLQSIFPNLIILTKNNNYLTEFNKFKFNNNNLIIETHLFKNGIKTINTNKIVKQQEQSKFKIYNKLNHFTFIFELDLSYITFYIINSNLSIHKKQTKLTPHFIYEEFDEKILNYYIDLLDENKIRISRLILDYDNSLLSIDNKKFNGFNSFTISNPIYIDFLYIINDPNLYIQEQIKNNIIIKNNIWLDFIIKTIEVNKPYLFNTKIIYKDKLLTEFLTESSPSFIIKDNIFLYINNNKIYNIKNKLIIKCKSKINSFFILNNKLYIIDDDLNIYEQLIDDLNIDFLKDEYKMLSIDHIEEKIGFLESDNHKIKNKIQVLTNKQNENNDQLKDIIEKNEDLIEINRYINENFDSFKSKINEINNKIESYDDSFNIIKDFIILKHQELQQDIIAMNEIINK